MNKDCAFCKTPEIKDREIAKDKFARAFLTNRPIVPGHTIIVPTRCVRTYEDLLDDEKSSIESLRSKIVHALKKAFGAEGFNFSWNDGRTAGQSVDHFHLHVIPRKPGDTGIHQYEPREFLYRPSIDRPEAPEIELRDITHVIKKSLWH